MIDCHIDTAVLNRVMREYAREIKADIKHVVRQQAGIMVGHLIAMTPPAQSKGQSMSDTGGITNSAKKAGEAQIAADIAVLFPTTKLKDEKVQGLIDAGWEWGTGRGKKIIRQTAFSEAEMSRVHQQARSPATGRVRTGSMGQLMAVTRASVRRAYTKRLQKFVGVLCAGWLAAANDLKTAKRATPAWIARHGAQPGGISEMRTIGGIMVRVFNSQAYFPNDMQRRMDRAINRRQRGLEKATREILERKAKKANADMGN